MKKALVHAVRAEEQAQIAIKAMKAAIGYSTIGMPLSARDEARKAHLAAARAHDESCLATKYLPDNYQWGAHTPAAASAHEATEAANHACEVIGGPMTDEYPMAEDHYDAAESMK